MKKLFCCITALVISLFYIQIMAVADESFCVTRSEMAAKIVNTYETIQIARLAQPRFNVSPFDDVVSSTSNKREIYICYSKDYMVGTGNRSFAPDANLTRAQAITIIHRLILDLSLEGTLTPNTTETIPFNDDEDIPLWAKESVYSMRKYSFIVGDENNNFNPNELISDNHVDSVLRRIETSAIEGQEYPKKIFCGIFDFELPNNSKVEDYDFSWWYDEQYDEYEPSFIAKISFDESDLEYLLNKFHFDTQTEDDIKEFNDFHDEYTKVLNNIRQKYSWWDVPEIDELDYKYIGTDSGVIVKNVSKYVFIKNIGNKYYLYIYRPA